MNENYLTHTSTTYPNTVTHPLLSNHRNIPPGITSKLLPLSTKPHATWPLGTSLLHTLLQQAGFSSNITIFQACSCPPAFVLSILSAGMFCPLTIPWLVSAQMLPAQRSHLHLSYHSVTCHYLKSSNSFICIVSFPHQNISFPRDLVHFCFFTLFSKIKQILNKVIK